MNINELKQKTQSELDATVKKLQCSEERRVGTEG